MTNSYFNTNKEQGVILFESEKKAQTQEEKILEIFKQYPTREFSPEEILGALNSPNVPLTSVRRAISNLANPKKYNAIEKTEVMKLGLYGKMVHTWRLQNTKFGLF